MTPQTVNAYYDPSLNSLNIPAGILQPPYFDAQLAGFRELRSHGSLHRPRDDAWIRRRGRAFDGYGNLKDWWAPADSTKFRRATRCIAEQYSQFTVNGGLHVQGDLVTGEATADLGGLVLAWRAWRSLRPVAVGARTARAAGPRGGAYAASSNSSWRSRIHGPARCAPSSSRSWSPPTLTRRRSFASMPRSPIRRIFRRAFDIPSASPMVKADRCVIW